MVRGYFWRLHNVISSTIKRSIKTKDDNGLEAVITLHIGSRYDGTKEIRSLMDKCHAALHNASLTLAAGQSVLCQFDRHDMVIDSDGVTRHGVMRFRLLISEVA